MTSRPIWAWLASARGSGTNSGGADCPTKVSSLLGSISRLVSSSRIPSSLMSESASSTLNWRASCSATSAYRCRNCSAVTAFPLSHLFRCHDSRETRRKPDPLSVPGLGLGSSRCIDRHRMLLPRLLESACPGSKLRSKAATPPRYRKVKK